MTQSTPGSGLEDLLQRLQTDQSIVEDTVSTILSTVPGYECVSAESLERSVLRNVQLSIRALRWPGGVQAHPIPEADALATERLEQGVALAHLLAGFRVSLSTILRRVLDLAPEYEVASQEALACSTVLWDLGDAFSARAVEVYQQAAIRKAVADSARRGRWITDAVTGALPSVDLSQGAAAYGVPQDQLVRAVVVSGRWEDPTSAAASLADALSAPGAQFWFAEHGGHLVGIGIDPDSGALPDFPVPPPGVTVAMGPLVSLPGLSSSHVSALRVLEAARVTGRTGWVDAAAMSWRMAIPASPETTKLVQARWVEPVCTLGEFGELILEAVSAYIRHGLSIPKASASIPVHVNTLRYRLRRFQELTGADFGDVDCLIEVAWALAPADISGSAAGPPVAGELDRPL